MRKKIMKILNQFKAHLEAAGASIGKKKFQMLRVAKSDAKKIIKSIQKEKPRAKAKTSRTRKAS